MWSEDVDAAREKRLERRVADLYATDPQFAAAQPDAQISQQIEDPSLRLSQIVQTVMTAYADRPAIGERSTKFAVDPQTGRTSLELLPNFDTLTYRDLRNRTLALAKAWALVVHRGQIVCTLGFPSGEYVLIDLALVEIGAVAVPLPTGAAFTQLLSIVAEAEPIAIAVTPAYLAQGVELALRSKGARPPSLVVFDYCPEVDEQRDEFEAARAKLASANRGFEIERLAELLERGQRIAATTTFGSDDDDDNTLGLLVYTSGSTGVPKGAMYPHRLMANMWRGPGSYSRSSAPTISINFMPASHMMGLTVLYRTLGAGGTAYFAAKSDLSTLFEDIALIRPTALVFVPRVWEMLFAWFQSAKTTEPPKQGKPAGTTATGLRDNPPLGGRVVSAMTGSAPTSSEVTQWVESFLDVHLVDGFGSTEAGVIFIDGKVQRPPVIDYKLADVPELGYFLTDHPHPRGELLVKTETIFRGYYKRPDLTAEVIDAEGFYCTGDIVAEMGPDRLAYLDRRNFVVKLAQGEFVAVSKLESELTDDRLIRQMYIYGSSMRSYILAVVVPTEEALQQSRQKGASISSYAVISSAAISAAPSQQSGKQSNQQADQQQTGREAAEGSEAWLSSLKALILGTIQTIAKTKNLQSYEIPRDIIIETQPFTIENGLLTGICKLSRPALKARYGARLEEMYSAQESAYERDLQILRESKGDRPVMETVAKAVSVLLGGMVTESMHFVDLGGDSLVAVTFSGLLRDIFNVEVPVGVILSPATDIQAIAAYIEARKRDVTRPTAETVHPRLLQDAELVASDLKLEKFIDSATLAAAAATQMSPVQATTSALPHFSAENPIRTVFLTGATGFLGRHLALEWLERLSRIENGTLICLVRGKTNTEARKRLDSAFDSGDPKLLTHFKELAEHHLQVLAGDKTEPNLGLDGSTWQQLAEGVDLVVDPAALVNHVLPYTQLFEPNVLGTAELIRLAVAARVKLFVYVSTVGVRDQIEPSSAFVEEADIRKVSPARKVNQLSYANGYANSKWASEVLLWEANNVCGLPVAIFRCDMILAGTRYAGQLNVPDMFTRLILSLVATGVAPYSFYELGSDGKRQRAHYDGLSVEFIAEAIATLSSTMLRGATAVTYHVANPHDDGLGLDEYVDWLIQAGHAITRIPDYTTWMQHFEIALRSLPDHQRHFSLLPLLHDYRQARKPTCTSFAPVERFRTAVKNAKVGTDEDIPHVTPSIILKYVTDLQLLGLL